MTLCQPSIHDSRKLALFSVFVSYLDSRKLALFSVLFHIVCDIPIWWPLSFCRNCIPIFPTCYAELIFPKFCWNYCFLIPNNCTIITLLTILVIIIPSCVDQCSQAQELNSFVFSTVRTISEFYKSISLQFTFAQFQPNLVWAVAFCQPLHSYTS